MKTRNHRIILAALAALLAITAPAFAANYPLVVDRYGNIVVPTNASGPIYSRYFSGSNIAANSLPLTALAASNAPDTNLFLRGDGSWAAPVLVLDLSSNQVVTALGGDPFNGSNLWTRTVSIPSIAAAGTPGSNTFLRGDGLWGVPVVTVSSNGVVLALGNDPFNGSNIWVGSLPVSAITAMNTPGGDSFLRGDGAWVSPLATGLLYGSNVVAGSNTTVSWNGTNLTVSSAPGSGQSASNAVLYSGATSNVTIVIGAGLLVVTNGQTLTIKTNGLAVGGGGGNVYLAGTNNFTGPVTFANSVLTKNGNSLATLADVALVARTAALEATFGNSLRYFWPTNSALPAIAGNAIKGGTVSLSIGPDIFVSTKPLLAITNQCGVWVDDGTNGFWGQRSTNASFTIPSNFAVNWVIYPCAAYSNMFGPGSVVGPGVTVTNAGGSNTYYGLLAASNPTVANGGSGYTDSDVLTVVGGVLGVEGTALQFQITVEGGIVTAVPSCVSNGTAWPFGCYSVVPENPVSVTGSTGLGATFNVQWQTPPMQ